MTEIPPGETSEAEKLEHFAASVAHDFNNLLTGILGNLELMQNRAKRSGVTNFDGYLEGARNAGGRAAIFAQRLLSFSGRAAQEAEAVPVATLIHDIVELTKESGLNLSVELCSGAPQVLCDAAQAELALHELLNNAMDAVRDSGAITIRTGLTGGFVSIFIEDTGTGMAPETLARAIEPFFTTRPNGAGKGLGLSIAERFARQTGGTLHVASQPSSGTVVSLRLPVI